MLDLKVHESMRELARRCLSAYEQFVPVEEQSFMHFVVIANPAKYITVIDCRFAGSSSSSGIHFEISF